MPSSSPSKVSRLFLSEDSRETISTKCKELIATLPKLDPPHPTHEITQYNGFWFHSGTLGAALTLSDTFKAQPSDIFICSSPKTGTTWLKALAFSIVTRGRFLDDDPNNPLLKNVPHNCVPTLEVDLNVNPPFLETDLPVLATHLPYACLPPSILESNCKIIYICREPKDTFVSWWHYCKKQEETFGIENGTTLEQEYQWFHDGKSMYGPYWDHVLEFLKQSVDRPDRVLFLTYEDLKSDTLNYVKKLAEFMDRPFSEEELKQGALEKIVARCNIKSLSNLEVNKSGFFDLKQWKISNSSFFRKGEVGDWKNLLTEEMAKSIDKITQEKFHPVGLKFSTEKITTKD